MHVVSGGRAAALEGCWCLTWGSDDAALAACDRPRQPNAVDPTVCWLQAAPGRLPDPGCLPDLLSSRWRLSAVVSICRAAPAALHCRGVCSWLAWHCPAAGRAQALLPCGMRHAARLTGATLRAAFRLLLPRPLALGLRPSLVPGRCTNCRRLLVPHASAARGRCQQVLCCATCQQAARLLKAAVGTGQLRPQGVACVGGGGAVQLQPLQRLPIAAQLAHQLHLQRGGEVGGEIKQSSK